MSPYKKNQYLHLVVCFRPSGSLSNGLLPFSLWVFDLCGLFHQTSFSHEAASQNEAAAKELTLLLVEVELQQLPRKEHAALQFLHFLFGLFVGSKALFEGLLGLLLHYIDLLNLLILCESEPSESCTATSSVSCSELESVMAASELEENAFSTAKVSLRCRGAKARLSSPR